MKNVAELDLASATVNEITARYPGTIAVFNDFGVDACCGGDVDLTEAALRDSVDVDRLTAALARVIDSADTAARS